MSYTTMICKKDDFKKLSDYESRLESLRNHSEWDHEYHNAKIHDTQNYGTYIRHEITIHKTVEFCGVTFHAEFQNGHTFYGNDFSAPSVYIEWYRSDYIPVVIDHIAELTRDDPDSDFQEFVIGLEEQAQKYFESLELTTNDDELVELYLKCKEEITCMEQWAEFQQELDDPDNTTDDMIAVCKNYRKD